ncbi:hypothetical protein B0H11DRAFT_2080306 [Mycena galericulata]|nr:hypothetical protein B0H11DRAFT_2080306 [Mycena galericulata]
MSRFPNELWLEICTYLPLEALRNLSSTHRALYALTRVLGFTEFKLYPYPYDYNPPQALLEAALERLEFWFSPKVAPHVRSCTARYNVSRWQGSPVMNDDKVPHVLVNSFFERLPKLTGLQRLCTDRIQWTQLGIVNLCALSALTHLEFSGALIAYGERINPASLTLRVSTFITHYDFSMNDIWISLLSRDTLRELNLYHPHALAKPGVLPFPDVHKFSVNELPMRAVDTLAMCAKFPALRVLVSDYRPVLRNMTPAQTTEIFPVLERYTGSYLNLHIFAHRTTLTHITLDSGFPFRNVLTELQGVVSLPNITSLTARFTSAAPSMASEDYFGEDELDALFTLFPRLTVLELTLMPDAEEDGGFASQPSTFLRMLPANAHLPNTLKSLSLEWDFPFEYGSTDSAKGNDPAAPDPANIPHFTALLPELVARCPGLTDVYLDGYHFLFVWWEVGWKAEAYSYDDAETLRAKRTELRWGPPVLLS